MKRTALAALAACLLSTSAFASSGSYVTTIRSNGAGSPNAIHFQMADDEGTQQAGTSAGNGVWYSFSLRSPGAPQLFLDLNRSRDLHTSFFFLTGIPIAGANGAAPTQANIDLLHIEDVPAQDATHVHIYRADAE